MTPEQVCTVLEQDGVRLRVARQSGRSTLVARPSNKVTATHRELIQKHYKHLVQFVSRCQEQTRRTALEAKLQAVEKRLQIAQEELATAGSTLFKSVRVVGNDEEAAQAIREGALPVAEDALPEMAQVEPAALLAITMVLLRFDGCVQRRAKVTKL